VFVTIVRRFHEPMGPIYAVSPFEVGRVGKEIELKFIGPEDAMSRLRDSPVLKRLAARRRASTRALQAVYFDTADFALRKSGIVLRVRDEGNGFLQTVKTIDGPDAATRTEIKSQVAALAPDIGAIGDKHLRRIIEKAAHGRDLNAVFAVEMQRTSVVLVPKRGTEIEAAFDIGCVKDIAAGNAEAPILEFELELLAGDANELVTCARELTAGLALTLAGQSKAARGYALVSGGAHAPVKSSSLTLPEKSNASDAFGRIVGHCLHHLLGNWSAVAVARDPEGVHQMRVALRRLRSAVSLFGGPFRAALHPLEEDIRWLAQVLGAARDLDVFEDEVFGPAARAHGEDPRLEALSVIVRARRQAVWENVISALESERCRALMLNIAAATLEKPWLATSTTAAARPVRTLARKRLARRYAQAMKIGKKVKTLDQRGRHALRIRVKKLRYALEFFGSLYPARAVAKYLRGLGVLQDVLGHMNDAAVARRLADEFMATGHNDPAAVDYACGIIAGWHLGHDVERHKTLSRQWQQFAKLKPLWK
jgi:triphosphatase